MLKLHISSILILVISFSALGQDMIWQYEEVQTQSFSSPKAFDINGDDILDIFIGFGVNVPEEPAGFVAIDGGTGEVIWKYEELGGQIFGHPLFTDVNNDEQADVLVGGRAGRFLALDGNDGTLIWAFDYEAFAPDHIVRANFYTGQPIADMNSDGVQDIVTSMGGTGVDSLRYPGQIMVISGADGNLIAADTVPDNAETYCSPLLVDFSSNIDLQIVFGSGGETLPGKLWQTSLQDLLDNNINNATILAESDTHGFIAVPSLADFNNDNKLDYCVPALDGRLILKDPISSNVLWMVEDVGYENYVSPALGFVTGDDTPDAVAVSHAGIFPMYEHALIKLINGSNGQVEWTDTLWGNNLFSPILADINNDEIDEIIHISNTDGVQLIAYNHVAGTSQILDNVPNAWNISSTPYIADLDNNGFADIVYGYTQFSAEGDMGFHLRRIELGTGASTSWPGYLGEMGDGILHNTILISTSEIAEPASISAYLSGDWLYWEMGENVGGQLIISDMIGRIIWKENNINRQSGRIPLREIGQGIHYLSFLSNEHRVSSLPLWIPSK